MKEKNRVGRFEYALSSNQDWLIIEPKSEDEIRHEQYIHKKKASRAKWFAERKQETQRQYNYSGESHLIELKYDTEEFLGDY